MSGINKAIILGRLGKDPETRYTADGKAVTSFSLATSYGSGDNEKTEWHRVVAWERTAEIIDEYVKKGNRLYVEGELQTRKWTDKDGNERYTTEIVARKIQLIDRNETGAEEQPRRSASSGRAATSKPDRGGVADMDDDVQF